MPAVEEILGHHQGQEVLIVGHGFLFSKVLQRVLDLPPEPRVMGSLNNAHWSEVAFSERGSWLVSHNVGAQTRDWSTPQTVR